MTAAITMVVVGKHSDTRGERRLHLAISALIGGLALAASAAANGPFLSLITISIAAAGISSTAGPFWTLPAGFLEGTAAAGGIALINSTGNLAGFVGPSLVGFLKQATGTFASGLLAMAAVVVLAGILALCIPDVARSPNRESAIASAVDEAS
jgi:ACS family tartrate transporter-like MFS transporter